MNKTELEQKRNHLLQELEIIDKDIASLPDTDEKVVDVKANKAYIYDVCDKHNIRYFEESVNYYRISKEIASTGRYVQSYIRCDDKDIDELSNEFETFLKMVTVLKIVVTNDITQISNIVNHRSVLTYQNELYIELAIKNAKLIITFSNEFDLFDELKLSLTSDLYLKGYNNSDEESVITINSQKELDLDDDNFEIYLTSTIHKALKQFNSIKEF